MPVEPGFDEASPMMIDVPVRHADLDGESDDEVPPIVVVAAMENLSVLFSDLRLNDGPRYFGEDLDVEALYAIFSRLSITETPTFNVYPSNVLVFDDPPSSAGFFTPYHVATVSNIVEDALTGLKTPIAASTNPNDARASLEEAWRKIFEEGITIASAKRQMEATEREYNTAYGLTLVSEAPSRLGSVRGHGRVIAEIPSDKKPIYEIPTTNLRAAQAAMVEMPSLEVGERAFQGKQVKDLLDTANEQQTWLDPGQAQSESPGPNPRACRNPSGHQQAEGSSSHRTSGRKGEGNHDMRSQRQSEHTSSRCRGDDENDSVYELPRPGRTHATSSRGAIPIAARIGACVRQGDHNARRRLNALTQSSLLEEDGPIRPA
ncbi:hypothetical protein ZWY2020_035887 [Hordeum vulgare]|nr:hypothetical protein ZWY2020_035887 [Hordeum vulgare]